ncbi:MAG: DUF2178 domain-containing protein [Candidatus Bathyarchaeota archaeon]|nr:DUF2178 domain-containing protein [Candidatus Bathyarchaeota archaeon]
MKLDTYRRMRSAIAALTGVIVAYAILQNSIFIAVAGVTIGMVALLISRRSIAEVTYDERSTLIQNKAALATLALTTIGLAVVGLSMVFLGRQGFGDFEQTGYVLAILANVVLGINALLRYYYAGRLGG